MADKLICLKFCEIEFNEWGCETRFPDGKVVGAWPHPDQPHYHVVAHRLGYGDDLLAYAREHEFCHAFAAEKLMGAPSVVLWGLAHDEKIAKGPGLYEEMVAQTLQRWLRANERPILSGCDWNALKSEALTLMA